MIFKYKKTIITASFDRELNIISDRIEKLNLPNFRKSTQGTIINLDASLKKIDFYKIIT